MMIPKDDKQQIDYPECPVLYLILCFKEIRNQHIEVRHEDNQQQEKYEGIDTHGLLGGFDIMFK